MGGSFQRAAALFAVMLDRIHPAKVTRLAAGDPVHRMDPHPRNRAAVSGTVEKIFRAVTDLVGLTRGNQFDRPQNTGPDQFERCMKRGFKTDAHHAVKHAVVFCCNRLEFSEFCQCDGTGFFGENGDVPFHAILAHCRPFFKRSGDHGKIDFDLIEHRPVIRKKFRGRQVETL